MSFDKFLKQIGLREYTKEDREELARREAIRRQIRIERVEINQKWTFVFGDDAPKQKKNLHVLENVTPRNIWFEDLYLFNQIKAKQPDQYYHDVKLYALKWQPPGSPYRLLIPLDDPQLQENVLNRLSTYPQIVQQRILFHFTTRNPLIPLYAPPVHPASLVSYRSKNDVFVKLCQQYMEGRFTIKEFENVMACGYDVWKAAMFNMLPEDEQVYHKYLTEKPEMKISDKQIEKLYLDDKISLEEYSDMKFPERKKKKDIEATTYPLPYNFDVCIICKGENGENGIIKCPTCTNMVCKICIRRTFLDEDTKEGSFLLVHRRYCLQLGSMPKFNPIIVPEPGYIRELKLTGRAAALERLIPQAEIREEESISDSEEEVDEEELERQRLLREKEIEEMNRKLRECPPALQALMKATAKAHKKYVHARKEIIEYQQKLDEKGHADNYYVRLQRLKGEAIEKLPKMTELVQDIRKKVVALKLEGEPSKLAIEKTDKLISNIDLLSNIETVEKFESSEIPITVEVEAEAEEKGGSEKEVKKRQK